MTKKLLLHSVLLIISLLLFAIPSLGQDDGFRSVQVIEQDIEERGLTRVVSDRVLIRFNPGVMDTQIAEIRQQMGAEFEFHLNFVDAEVWQITPGTVAETVRDWSNHPSIDVIQPDYVFDIPDYSAERIETPEQPEDGQFPNDPLFDLLWGMYNTGQEPFNGTPGADISAPLAWEIETGDSEVIIAVLDTGVDYNHPDLQGNMWQDGNGNFGANFAGGPQNDPMDHDGHGTHVAGTVAAVGNNNIGVTGVMWEANIMAVRVCGDEGCPLSAISQGVAYAINNGAKISNNSYGTQTPTSSGPSSIYITMMQNAQQQGHFFITSSGNANNDNDVLNVYPANLMLDFDNVFTVGNSTPDDTRNSTSNYGLETVHLFAPGTLIASTYLDNGYAYLSGTSMASPMVAGIAGLLLSRNPNADYHYLRDRLLEGVDEIDAFSDISITGGRINAWKTLTAADGPIIELDRESLTFQVTEGSSSSRDIEVTNLGNEPLEVEVSTLFDNGAVTIETNFSEAISVQQDGAAALSPESMNPNAALYNDTPLTASPGSFTVEPGQSLEVTVTFDASGLDFGDYTGEVIVSSNAANEPELSVPVSASVVIGDVVTLWEQLPEGNQGIITGVFDQVNVGVFSADDFKLSETSQVSNISTRGFQIDQNLLEDVLIDYSIYIFADDDGVPAGSPDEPGTELFSFTAEPGDAGFDVVKDGNAYTFEIDFTEAGAEPWVLDSGRYWLVASPRHDLNSLAGESRWNWSRGEENLNEPMLIDPDNVFQAGHTDWTIFSDIGLTWPSFGLVFSIQGLELPDAAPEMVVSPEEISIELEQGNDTATSITVGNTGNVPLSVELSAFFDENPTGDEALQNQNVLVPGETSLDIAPGGEQQVILEVNASELEVGNYSGEVVLSGNDPNNPEYSIPVSVSISEAVIGPLLSIDPESLTLSAEIPDEVSAEVEFSNPGDQTLAVDLTTLISSAREPVSGRQQNTGPLASGQSDAFSVSPASFSVPAGESETVTVTLNSGMLEGGEYDGTINVQSNSASNPSRTIPVDISVTEPEPEPENFALLLPENGSTLTVDPNTDGVVSFEWETSENTETYTFMMAEANDGFDDPFFESLSSSDGSGVHFSIPDLDLHSVLTSEGYEESQTHTLYWSVRAEGPGGEVMAETPFELNIELLELTEPQPVLAFNPESFSFELFPGESGQDVLTIENTGEATLTVDLVISNESGGWLSVSPDSKQIPAGESRQVNVMADANGLSPGDYELDVSLMTNDPGQSEVVIPVALVVSQPQPEPFSLLAPESGAEVITIPGDDTTVEFEWETSTQAEIYTWVLFESDGSPESPLYAFEADGDGAQTQFTITLDELNALLDEQETDPGEEVNLKWSVIASAAGAEQPADQPFDINLMRGAAFILTEPTELDFELPEGESGQQSFEITNEGFINLEYTLLVPEVAWLLVESDLEGTVAPGNSDQIVVTVNASDITPGEYSVDIQIESNDPDQPVILFPINLEVLEGTSSGNEPELPESVQLHQNYPNPFNSATTIRYELPESSEVRLEVFNMMGEQVFVLDQGARSAGYHTLSFDANSLASGIYLYRLQTQSPEGGSKVIVRKMTLIK